MGYTYTVVNSPSISRGTTSQTPTVTLSRAFCEVVRLSKMKQSLYQDDFNIELVDLWIHTPYKAGGVFFFGVFSTCFLPRSTP